MRISRREKNVHARIHFLISRLKSGQTITLIAFGYAVSTAIWMASIIRTKLGDVHQLLSLTELKDPE
jgi:transketolase C-terminal domain/subunit